MKSAGRYEIQSPIVTGAVDTYSARDPESGATVLLHVLPPGCEIAPREKFLEFAPGCPGKILDSGLDVDSQRSFVVTEYPKDRKALLLWIKSLSAIAAKPAPAKAPPPPPVSPPASDGATRMFDPSAIFGAPPAGEPVPPAAAAAATDGSTRMFDPSAIFGAAPAEAPAQAAAAAAGDGATRMFDPAAVFGGASAPTEPAPPRPTPARTPHPSAAHDSKPKTDPFADLKAALARGSGSQPAAPAPAASTKQAGEFTRRFELPKEFRGAPMRVDRTSQSPIAKPGIPEHDASDKKGVFTLMMEAYAKRVDEPTPAAPEKAPSPTAASAPTSDGATRMFDPSAIFGPGAPATTEKPPESPAADLADYPATVRMPALNSDKEEDEKK